MPTMTTPAIAGPRHGAFVHYVAADNPECSTEPVVFKSCREGTVADVADDTVIVAFGPDEPLRSAWHDGVTLPKIEPGPSGRDVGSWHYASECG